MAAIQKFELRSGHVELVEEKPRCEVCRSRVAQWDFLSRWGNWLYGCEGCYVRWRAFRTTGPFRAYRIITKGQVIE